ncbi:MAG: translation initiation factor IF-2 [Acidobacteria bacterium]|nr:translation initiation factor IF-2 [Acidobacteriota bacterium]
MVQQLRVVDLAQTMGITPTELIFKLRSIGVSVSGEEDILDLGTVRAIITGETLQKRPREVIVRRDTSEEEAGSTSARDRLARRKRRKIIKTEREIEEVGGRGTAAEAEEPADTELATQATAGAAEALEELEESVVEETVLEEAQASEQPQEEIAEAETATEPTTPAPAKAKKPHKGTKAAKAAKAPEPEEEEEEDEEAAVKPEVEISEEELTAARAEAPEEPQRVRARKAHTPLEQGLRELSPDEIKERLKAQRTAEKRARSARKAAGTSRKAKAAADAREIRELLNKFEEQKLKTQQEAATPSARPGRRPGPGARPTKKRKRRQREDTAPAPPQPRRTVQFKEGERPEGPIILSEMVTPKELADKLNITVKDLLGLLIQRGVMVTTNQSLPHELAEQVCADLEVEAMVASVEELIEYEREEAEEMAGPTVPRPPVVTVMGHVDHGKTSLLDAIRSSRVAEQEAGGITQHIGASRITAPGDRSVVFIDTPGHEAFTQMRARGAHVTDIVVLVVAADDGVMPQTIEAINHARAANVPLIVAINKIDKANANPDRVKQALAEQEVLVEDWGGEVPSVEVSAKKHTGIDDLLDMILLVAEMKDLKATREGAARGVVLEAQKEKGRGIVATVLVQQGTLAVGDYFFCGSTWGRVRALTNDLGSRVDEAGPTDPVEVTGFDDVPGAGDLMQVVENEERALEVASYRSQREKEDALMATRKVSLENLFDQIAADEIKELHIVVKADVQGSVEVLRDTLGNLSTDKVKINVLHGSVGAVTTNDVMLASASNAIIIGFNVRPERTARNLADEEQVDIRLYTVIYNLIEDIKKAMVGLLEPEFKEEDLGQAEVREIFRVPKIGAIAGCHVTEGVVPRSAKVRLLRDNVVVYEGTIASLRRFKEDASEVRQGFECGIGLERYQDIKVGDIIEAYKLIEVAPEL